MILASTASRKQSASSPPRQGLSLVKCLRPQEMKELGEREYYALVEGEITRKYKATVPEDIDRQRVRFMQVRGLLWDKESA